MENISHSKKSKFETILNSLLNQYRDRVPQVNTIIDAMVAKGMINSGSDIENDHIAFRSLGLPHLGIASMEKIFLHYGYEKKDYYYFDHKHLNAYWYSPPVPRWPRIFISELRVKEMSLPSQHIIEKYTKNIKTDSLDLFSLDDETAISHWLHKSLWEVPSLSDYDNLATESEYAAWVIYNRYYLNHFTIAVHNLPSPFHKLETFNQFVEDLGIQLNSAGGKIKVSGDGLLAQSSTLAGMVEARFKDGETKLVPGSYVEFAYREILPEFRNIKPDHIERHHRREGFETQNADKIFESTYLTQIKKKT
ncbi:DUF1338 domain-containing protein [Membranihabitans marinus]|uniref:DUF1338 domain-containing protein n=1 Tax=Membranihabitans marinus TaxID=1227546 RepID=UPI001F300CF0|nr:DUF1338 domain-containing protein [Membranihabitans marinus]